MDQVLAIINTLANDLLTIGVAALVLALFYELLSYLFPRAVPRGIGVFGVLLVAIGFVVLPGILSYLTGL